MSIELDQDGLNTLTDEEREAIAGDPSPEELEIMRSQADDDEDEDGDDDDNTDVDAESKDAVDDTAATNDSDDAVTTDEADEPTATEFKPQFKAELPADYAEQVASLKTAKADLKAEYKNGDIDFDEYEERRDELSDKESDLKSIALKAEIAQDMGAQTVEQEWTNTVNSFNDEVAKAEGLDYRKDLVRQKDLDLFVKALAGDKANVEKPMRWFLQEAHKRVNALHGVVAKPEAKDPKSDAKAKRKPPVADLPKSLAGVPGSDDASDTGNEFADIDRLDGMELEIAIAKMSPSQREKYMVS